MDWPHNSIDTISIHQMERGDLARDIWHRRRWQTDKEDAYPVEKGYCAGLAGPCMISCTGVGGHVLVKDLRRHK